VALGRPQEDPEEATAEVDLVVRYYYVAGVSRGGGGGGGGIAVDVSPEGEKRREVARDKTRGKRPVVALWLAYPRN
jgi:hypothetical protein